MPGRPFFKKFCGKLVLAARHKKTLLGDKNYLAGLNVFKGKITCKGVAEAFNMQYFPPEEAIST